MVITTTPLLTLHDFSIPRCTIIRLSNQQCSFLIGYVPSPLDIVIPKIDEHCNIILVISWKTGMSIHISNKGFANGKPMKTPILPGVLVAQTGPCSQVNRAGFRATCSMLLGFRGWRCVDWDIHGGFFGCCWNVIVCDISDTAWYMFDES